MRFLQSSAILVMIAASSFAQDPAALKNDPAIKAAMEAIRRNEPHFIDEQVRICEIAAPPFHEQERGKELQRLFKEAGS